MISSPCGGMTSRSRAWEDVRGRCRIGLRHFNLGGLVVGASLSFMAAARGAAQLSGVVRDEAGRPIPAAVVEGWSGHARTGFSETADNGLFRIVVEGGRPLESIAVRAIGFRPRALAPPFAIPLVITMQASMVPLPEIEVVAAEACTTTRSRDHPALWAAVRSKYADPQALGTVTAEFRSFDDVVAAPDLSVRRDSLPGRGKFGLTAEGRATLEGVIQRRGYRWPGDPLRAEKWDYPPLERELVTHFLSRRFAASHRVVGFADSADAKGVMAALLCAQRRTGAFVDAIVTLRADSTIELIRWFVKTAPGAPEAGGAVLLLPPDQPLGRLVPTASMAWRRTMAGTYRQRTYLFTGWK